MKKGVYKCKKCNGTGTIPYSYNYIMYEKNYTMDSSIECPKCKGDGHLDWIENIVGKNLSDSDREFYRLKNYFKNHKPKLVMPMRITKEKKNGHQ